MSFQLTDRGEAIPLIPSSLPKIRISFNSTQTIKDPGILHEGEIINLTKIGYRDWGYTNAKFIFRLRRNNRDRTRYTLTAIRRIPK